MGIGQRLKKGIELLLCQHLLALDLFKATCGQQFGHVLALQAHVLCHLVNLELRIECHIASLKLSRSQWEAVAAVSPSLL